jgi:DNA-binding GntR family transcriptional regulator
MQAGDAEMMARSTPEAPVAGDPENIISAPALLPARSPSLAEQAAETIVNGIASGALKPGQRLIEADLAATLKMSRVPLREALKILEAQGIVAATRHRGSYIPRFDDRRIEHICEARIALERIAIRGAVATYAASPDRLSLLDAIVAQMENAAARLAWMEVSQADLAFHREICRASDNDVVLTLWESLARHVFIVFGQEIRDEEDAAIMGPQHRRLRDLLAAGEVERLMGEIGSHILRLRRPERN